MASLKEDCRQESISMNQFELPKDDQILFDDLQAQMDELNLTLYLKPSKLPRNRKAKRAAKGKTLIVRGLLQSILPNVHSRRKVPNINFLLAKTLEYLNSIKHSDENKEKLDQTLILKEARSPPSIPRPLRKVAIPYIASDARNSRYIFAFNHAPFGVIICRCDGSFLRANPYFYKMEQCGSVLKTISSLATSEPAVDAVKVSCPVPPILFLFLPANQRNGIGDCCPILGPHSPQRFLQEYPARDQQPDGASARLSYTEPWACPNSLGASLLHVEMTAVSLAARCRTRRTRRRSADRATPGRGKRPARPTAHHVTRVTGRTHIHASKQTRTQARTGAFDWLHCRENFRAKRAARDAALGRASGPSQQTVHPLGLHPLGLTRMSPPRTRALVFYVWHLVPAAAGPPPPAPAPPHNREFMHEKASTPTSAPAPAPAPTPAPAPAPAPADTVRDISAGATAATSAAGDDDGDGATAAIPGRPG